jgi:hypothetical protein
MLHHRLARGYETLPASSEAIIHVASIDNLTKRITDETTLTWRGTYRVLSGPPEEEVSSIVFSLVRICAASG